MKIETKVRLIFIILFTFIIVGGLFSIATMVKGTLDAKDFCESHGMEAPSGNACKGLSNGEIYYREFSEFNGKYYFINELRSHMSHNTTKTQEVLHLE